MNEQNLDEEILKIKEKLASKVANTTGTTVAPARGTDKRGERAFSDDGIGEDEMDIDVAPRNKRTADVVLSDDEDDFAPVTKKRRTAPAKTTRAPPASRARQSSATPKPTSSRKPPVRKVTSRSKKVRLYSLD